MRPGRDSARTWPHRLSGTFSVSCDMQKHVMTRRSWRQLDGGIPIPTNVSQTALLGSPLHWSCLRHRMTGAGLPSPLITSKTKPTQEFAVNKRCLRQHQAWPHLENRPSPPCRMRRSLDCLGLVGWKSDAELIQARQRCTEMRDAADHATQLCLSSRRCVAPSFQQGSAFLLSGGKRLPVLWQLPYACSLCSSRLSFLQHDAACPSTVCN